MSDRQSEYGVLGHAAGDGPLSAAVDRAIAAENARAARKACGRCAGTGSYYTEPTDGSNHWVRHRCERCGGTGSGK